MTYDLPRLQARALLTEGELDAAKLMPTLTESERAQVRGFAGQIDPGAPAELSAYGAAEQGAMQTWLDVAVKTVADQGAPQGEQGVDKMLAHLRGFDRLCAARRFLFGRVGFARLRKEYLELEPAVEMTAAELLDQSIGLRRVSKVLEKMELENQAHMARLSTYLVCGQVRLAELRDASATGTAEGTQAVSGLADAQALARLERRLHDIALTRQVALQTRAQLLLLLDGNAHMIDTMERTLRHTLPLWKSQVLVALGLSAQAEARAEAARARRALERDMAARNSLLARLLAALRGGSHANEREALLRSNAKLLDEVAELRQALQSQLSRSENMRKTLT